MTKIEPAVRLPGQAAEGTGAAGADLAALSALFGEIMGQAVGAPDASPITGAVEGTNVGHVSVSAAPAVSSEAEAGAPAETMAEQLLKALGVGTAKPENDLAARSRPAGHEPGRKGKKLAEGEQQANAEVPKLDVAIAEAPAPVAPIAAQAAPLPPISRADEQPGALTVAFANAPAARSALMKPLVDGGSARPSFKSAPGVASDSAKPSDRPPATDEAAKPLQGRVSADLQRLVQQITGGSKQPKAQAAAPTSAREPDQRLPTADTGGSFQAIPGSPAPILPSQVQVSHTATAGVDPTASQPLSDPVERHLDVAKDGEWLDQLARDIAQAGGEEGTSLRFRLHPAHLGSMHVEITRDAQGTSVRLTADTEAGRALLADAQPKLVQEARAQGLRLAETHVDLGSSGHGSQQKHAPGEPQIKTARLLHREEERDGKPTSVRAERYA